MKFLYEYRTSDNAVRHGECAAANRDAAFAALKAKGIRPARLVEAPGLANKLFGKGKRWIAIVLLAVAAASSAYIAFDMRRSFSGADFATPRAQLYGDPVVIAECEEAGWTNVFSSAFDCYLARYAIPGKKAEAVHPSRLPLAMRLTDLVPILPSDFAEVAQMKRMVNGMKLELAEYLAAGGTARGYVHRLDIRQRAEIAIYESAQRRVRHLRTAAELKAKNAELRAMGLPMVGTDPDDL